jgi:succinyl-diaminopimelate desuccinylase
MSTVVSQAQQWLDTHQDALVKDLQDLLRIPSLEAPAEPRAPFGSENRRALDMMLALSAQHGLRTKDIEGYCGWAEFGEGPGMVMVLGHLDVVPVGPGWKHEPFGAEIDEGYIYARGAGDDKGPTMASFYAALALMKHKPDLGCRVRLVFGCNEESGFGCIQRYMKTEEPPTFGVAPDGGWPLIHAEKGISDFIVEVPLPGGDFALQSIAGGQRPNIVIDSCCAELKVGPSIRSHVEAKLAQSWDKNVDFSWEGDLLRVHAGGKAAHGSWPYGGDSAAIRTLRFLAEIAPLSSVEAYEELFERPHIAGQGLGIAGSDEPSGDLTANLGIIETVDGKVRMTINVRYPVTWDGDANRAKCEKHLAELKQPWTLASMSDSKPLYFPLDHPLVTAVVEAYQSETGDNKKPGVMGGGTYARAVPNSVAIGTGWLGDGPAHETDERIALTSLSKMARIYVRILDRLTDLASEAGA